MALAVVMLAVLTCARDGFGRPQESNAHENDVQAAAHTPPDQGQKDDALTGDVRPGAGSPKAGQEDESQKKTPAAVVLEVRGTVHRAKPGISPLAKEGWVAVHKDDRLEGGTQIRTGLRSFVHLQFGKSTFVSIERATIASIDQFYHSATKESVRIGLGYGAVRGGSTEGTVRSDLVVDSPVATMAKRGTEGWQIAVEPQTGYFNISLARYGLVEAIHKLGDNRTIRRKVRPGEYATAQNIAGMWLKQDIFDRAIKFFGPEGVTLADARFSSNNTTGVGMMAPGGGARLAEFAGRAASATGQAGGQLGPTLSLRRTPIRRSEGNFGVPDVLNEGG